MLSCSRTSQRNTLVEMQVNKVMARWEPRGMPTDGTERRNENEMTNDGMGLRVFALACFGVGLFYKDDDDDPRTKSDAVYVIALSACLSLLITLVRFVR
jgi:hypothetical protein